MDIDAGSLVYSIAGRDKGGVFVVVGLEGAFCFLVDGKIRRCDKPKKKKLKHIRPAGVTADALKEKIERGERLTNSETRKVLAAFHGENNQSG